VGGASHGARIRAAASWRGAHGVFGFVEPGTETGGGCRAYSQTIYIAGRPNRSQGVACKQPDGAWKMTG
jgi:surface antigen